MCFHNTWHGFIPTAAAQTTTGNQGVLQQVTEDRVEVVVNDRDVIVDLRNVITVLRKVTPMKR